MTGTVKLQYQVLSRKSEYAMRISEIRQRGVRSPIYVCIFVIEPSSYFSDVPFGITWSSIYKGEPYYNISWQYFLKYSHIKLWNWWHCIYVFVHHNLSSKLLNKLGRVQCSAISNCYFDQYWPNKGNLSQSYRPILHSTEAV